MNTLSMILRVKTIRLCSVRLFSTDRFLPEHNSRNFEKAIDNMRIQRKSTAVRENQAHKSFSKAMQYKANRERQQEEEARKNK